MQSKGTLGSIIAGIIAIFLVLVCLFYLSFTLVSSKQEAKAEQYALSVAGQQGKNSEQYNKAYKSLHRLNFQGARLAGLQLQ